jgi:hypothetical protein
VFDVGLLQADTERAILLKLLRFVNIELVVIALAFLL